jgi:vancomycin aglycone glucosyltransferase
VAALVHHGGAGTTAAAARAGVAQVVTPMFGDQFYWGGRIVQLGVGAATPHATMTAESLSAALRAACEPDVAIRARSLAERVGRDGAKIAARRLAAEYGR